MNTPPPTNTPDGVGRTTDMPAGRPALHDAARGRRWSPRTRRVTPPAPLANDAPPLRLVHDPAADVKTATPRRPAPPTPISGPTDPRWVLAVRTAEALQGDVLPPKERDKLMALAKAMGLTPFDGCLILAMIQDQARRGLLAQTCPAAAEPQLAMVPLPQPREMLPELRRNAGRVALLAAGVLALQGLLVWLWLS